MNEFGVTWGDGKLEMTGVVHLSGPQSTDQIPEDVLRVFDDSEVEKVAVCRLVGGRRVFTVYYRFPPSDQD